MKKLGMIGGTGPQSTIEYYRQIEYAVYQKTCSFPELAIESMNVFDVLHFSEVKDYEGLAQYLLHGAQCLKDAGCDFACLTGMTPHIVFEQLSERSPIPFVSMIDAACAKTEEMGIRKAALLGTYPTMAGSFFQKPFLQKGIEVITPSEEEMQYIEEKIEKELELGRIIPETQVHLMEIANRLIHGEKAQALILGCTELPMIIHDGMVDAPCMDVMRIHIDQLVSMIVEE